MRIGHEDTGVPGRLKRVSCEAEKDSGKSKEFKAVFVVNVSDERLPLRSLLLNLQDQQLRADILERERQLLYVGLTRARDEVVLTWTGYPSQFLEDILTDPELEVLEAAAED
ncbi:MAG: 3'-5' exonuclease [Cyanobacteria bacterium J06641_5]